MHSGRAVASDDINLRLGHAPGSLPLLQLQLRRPATTWPANIRVWRPGTPDPPDIDDAAVVAGGVGGGGQRPRPPRVIVAITVTWLSGRASGPPRPGPKGASLIRT